MKQITAISESSYLERSITAELTLHGQIRSSSAQSEKPTIHGLLAAERHLIAACDSLRWSPQADADFLDVKLTYWHLVEGDDMFCTTIEVSLGDCASRGSVKAATRRLIAKVHSRFLDTLTRAGIVLY